MDIMLERMLSLIPKKPDGKFVHGEKKKFCERIGAPTNIVSEWETEKTKSYRNYVHATALAYGVSVEWLKGETDEKKAAPENGDGLRPLQQEAWDLIVSMPDDQLERFIRIAKAALGS